MTDTYLVSTFRNDWNRDYNLKISAALNALGISVYLPQRDTEQKGNRLTTFQQNKIGIDNAKLLTAIGTKTQTANWGFEVGYAYGRGKPILVITDAEHPVELMPENASSKKVVVQRIDDISSYSNELVKAIKELLT